MTTALEGGEGSASLLGRSLPPGKTRYPLYRRLGGPRGGSGQVRKISPPTGIGSTDRPARSQALYWLIYSGPLSYAALPTNNFRICTQTSSKLHHNAATQTKCPPSYLCSIPKQSSRFLCYSVLYQPTLAGRTSGHNPWTFFAVITNAVSTFTYRA
jgi:hypothetical protein